MEATQETKTCISCNEEKPLSHFYSGRAKCKKCVIDESKRNYYLRKKRRRHVYPEDCVDPHEFDWYYPPKITNG